MARTIGGARFMARNTAFGLAFGLPILLLGGAIFSQYILGLAPCEMCYWQRWPHWAAMLLALLGIVTRNENWSDYVIYLAAIAIAISGFIGAYHAGVEYGWWDGVSSCSGGLMSAAPGENALDNFNKAPLIRCDVPQWTLAGISLAGYNFLISCGGALVIWMLLTFARKKAGSKI